MNNRSGIYAIENIVTGKKYIGSSDNIPRRFSKHQSQLRTNTHHNIKLQHSWNKYGSESFLFYPLLFCPQSELIDREQCAIDTFQSVLRGYNILPQAGRTSGYKHTDEARQNMSMAQTGREVSLEARDNMRKGQLGRKQPSEQIAKRKKTIAAKSKKPWTEEAKKILVNRNKSMVFTAEIREKMSIAKLGKKRGSHTQEHRDKIAESNRLLYTTGVLTKNHAARSEEVKAKVSEGLRRYWAGKHAAAAC